MLLESVFQADPGLRSSIKEIKKDQFFKGVFKQPLQRDELTQIDFDQYPDQLHDMILNIKDKSFQDSRFGSNQPSVCKILTEQDEPDIDVNKLFEQKNGAMFIKAHQSLIQSFPQRYDFEISKNLLHEF